MSDTTARTPGLADLRSPAVLQELTRRFPDIERNEPASPYCRSDAPRSAGGIHHGGIATIDPARHRPLMKCPG
ncbi:MAG: hypothetical protein IT518_03595 [Burkholderiales bacterium]|nr:hypothetical protein [Burkholderiales bacterium]